MNWINIDQPMLSSCQLGPWEQTLVKFENKIGNLSYKKMSSKRPPFQISMCFALGLYYFALKNKLNSYIAWFSNSFVEILFNFSNEQFVFKRLLHLIWEKIVLIKTVFDILNWFEVFFMFFFSLLGFDCSYQFWLFGAWKWSSLVSLFMVHTDSNKIILLYWHI